MSVDFYTESPPRISFSSDLHPNNPQTQITNQTDLTDFTFHSQPTSDFHFSFSSTTAAINEPSSADELFSDGQIRPLQFPQNSKPPLKKSIEIENPETDQPIKAPIKSIWGIKRSSSLHCEESIHKKNSSSFWSLPLLARSNSTGSVSVQKNGSKENQSQSQSHSQRQQKQMRNSSSSSSSDNSSFSMYNFSQKPPLKKNYGNGIRMVNPVLNVPSSFGFSSLFRGSSNNGKERKNKK